MEEVIAKGRFPWARLIVMYKDGTKVFEDRSNEYFWDDLPKKNILSLSIQFGDSNGPIHTLLGSVKHNYQFFMFRKRKLNFLNGDTEDIAFGVGMVISRDGTCQILEVKPNGSVATFMSNVITDGRNLTIHGIKLEEID